MEPVSGLPGRREDRAEKGPGDDGRRGDTTSAAFFEEMYRRAGDPWQFASSGYELGRYDQLMAALGGRRFRRGFEPGASIGVLSQRLATVCDELVTLEIAETAAAQARERCREVPWVTVRTGALPEAMPEGSFDLVVLSEVGYYFGAAELGTVVRLLVNRLEAGGVLLGVHWLGESADHLLHGDEVHAIAGAQAGLVHDWGDRLPGFRLDRWVRV